MRWRGATCYCMMNPTREMMIFLPQKGHSTEHQKPQQQIFRAHNESRHCLTKHTLVGVEVAMPHMMQDIPQRCQNSYDRQER